MIMKRIRATIECFLGIILTKHQLLLYNPRIILLPLSREKVNLIQEVCPVFIQLEYG